MISLVSSYWPISTNDDDDKITIPQDWRDYPALRPSSLDGVTAPSNTVFVKTGGNALQAIDRSALQQKGVVAVTVPYNGKPGKEMLVSLKNPDRMVRTLIPDDVQPGHVFLMRVPDVTAVTGIPVDIHSNVAITPSQEVQVAQSYVPPTNSNNNDLPDDLLFEQSVEMTYPDYQVSPQSRLV